ncbi:MAG: hypothetical protein P8M25_09890, partial [Paracoccaceae bacterium]|nr:hypothetical protein [Paracoccaceae bacterium]
MKPDFALSLSFEGISLLYRQNSSWANVGYVNLAAENLAEQLEQLNSKGQRVSGGPLRSKIVIPNEQIRYIVVVYTEQEAASSLQVEAALTGATPYAVSDLVYDWELHASQLYIAAVARETLDEAEQFANLHKFNPVRFVATPAQNTLQREIDFGACASASSLLPARTKVETDKTIIKVSGHVIDPNPPVVQKPLQAPLLRAQKFGSGTPTDLATKNNLTTAHLAGVSAIDSQRTAVFSSDLKLSPALLVTNFAADDTPQSRLPNLILTLGTVLMLSGIAAWMFVLGGASSGFLQTENHQEKVPIIDTNTAESSTVPSSDDTLNATATNDIERSTGAEIFVASDSEAEDDLILLDGALPFAQGPTKITDEQAKIRYAATGIWLKAPTPPALGKTLISEDLYAASIDREILSYDAIALPARPLGRTDRSPKKQSDPPRFGQTFQLNADGLVIATVEGALSPDGYFIYLGKPEKLPPKRIDITSVSDPVLLKMAKVRPRLRPNDLAETGERLKLGGRTKAELALLRPRLRPATLTLDSQSDEVSSAIASVANSLIPKLRPTKLKDSISKDTQKPKPESLANNATVAQKATLVKALNLRKVNLIGVYGTSSNRRALVRLS